MIKNLERFDETRTKLALDTEASDSTCRLRIDTYDFECDDLSNAQAILMAIISNYGSNIILEVVHDHEFNKELVTPYEQPEREVVLFYKGLGVPTRQILDSKGVVPSMNAANAKKVVQEMADYSQKCHSGTSTRVGCELCKGPHYTRDCPLKEEVKTLEEAYYIQFGAPYPQRGRYRAADSGFYQRDGASIKALEIQIGQISKVLKERGSGSLLSSTETNPRDHVKSSTTIDECEISSIHRIRPNRYGISNEQKDDRLSLTEINQANIPFLGRLKEYSYDKNEILKEFEKLQVYALGLRERMELDLEARLMGEALFLNRSRDPEFGDYIELNDLNEPLELRNHDNEDLGPTIDEGEIIDELNGKMVETSDDKMMNEKVDEYPSLCDYDRKIKNNCAYNLKVSCMIGYKNVDANFFPILPINFMSKNFYNSIMKDKIKYKGKNVVGAFINVPFLIGVFSVITDFAVVENMDNYRDEGMGDIIVGKPFCREVCVDAR
uniref:Uncharacterized protein n=1 Tax=Tanacetum cinerariifolium TaxID=118510 RepID=A0A6L2P837_TANCI|nr:hypothetical protein [Tanacetum cinerariifolium]